MYKTLQEVKEEYARQLQKKSWDFLIAHTSFHNREKHYDEVSKRYAIVVSHQALHNASLKFEESDHWTRMAIKDTKNIPII